MSRSRVPDNVGAFLGYRFQFIVSAVCIAALGALLIAGGVEAWLDSEADRAWRVVSPPAGVTLLCLAAMLAITLVWRPRASSKTLAARSAGVPGVRILSSRSSDRALAAVVVSGSVTTAAGVALTTGVLRVALAALAVYLGVLTVGAIRALRRPRWLHLTGDGVESAALRSREKASWRELEGASVSITVGRGGQMLARFTLPRRAGGVEELRKGTSDRNGRELDIEYMSTGVSGERLLQVIEDLIQNPPLRAVLRTDADHVIRMLVDPYLQWPSEEASSP